MWVLQFYVHVHEIPDFFWVQHIFRHKFIVVKSACYLHVHLSIWFSVAPTAWIFSVKFYIGDSYENLSEKIQICLKWGKNIGHWQLDISTLLLVTSNCHKSTLLTNNGVRLFILLSRHIYHCGSHRIDLCQIFILGTYISLEKSQIW